MTAKRILSIDGGGIRGLIPATVLVEIERLAGKRIAELFDVIAGTSTGGILAAGLCVPAENGKGPRYAASDLVSLYRDHGAEIFSASWLRKLVSLFFGSEYSPEKLEYYLKQQLGACRLADAVTGLLVTAYDMRAGEAWFFSREAARNKPERNYLLWEVARATSAAPTYFPPAKLPGSGGQGALVDGGVFANNPGLCAWVDGHEQVNATSEVMILSLGTGSVPHPITFDRARRWGKVMWAQPAIGAFLDGQSDTTEYELKQLVDPANYLRLQVALPVENERMDDASESNIKALQGAAVQMLSDHSTSMRLADFCNRLTGGPPSATATSAVAGVEQTNYRTTSH